MALSLTSYSYSSKEYAEVEMNAPFAIHMVHVHAGSMNPTESIAVFGLCIAFAVWGAVAIIYQ